MIVLALDIATRTGFATSDGQYGAFKAPGGVDHVKACTAFGDWLCDLLTTHEPGVVVVEAPVKGGIGYNAKAIKLAGVVAYVCGLRGLSVFEFSPSVIKKFATGKGNADKHQMIEAASDLGFDLMPDQSDEADAIHLVRFAQTQFETEDAA